MYGKEVYIKFFFFNYKLKFVVLAYFKLVLDPESLIDVMGILVGECDHIEQSENLFGNVTVQVWFSWLGCKTMGVLIFLYKIIAYKSYGIAVA